MASGALPSVFSFTRMIFPPSAWKNTGSPMAPPDYPPL
jgi:hypothetical protein